MSALPSSMPALPPFMQEPSTPALPPSIPSFSFHDLVPLYEMGLLVNADLDEQAFHQRILEYLAHALHAAGGCLWLYHPSQAQFVLRASCGEYASYLGLVTDALAGMALEEKSVQQNARRTLRIITWSPENMVILHPLACAGQLVGAVAFSMKGGDLTAEQHMLCAQMCHITAVVLRNHQARITEQQATIDRERSRIAREIHDGAAQDIAHVMHLLELVQRIFERQPANQTASRPPYGRFGARVKAWQQA